MAAPDRRLERSLRPWLDRLVALDDLDPARPVVVACSGGPDSLALLALASARGLRCDAVHVDHGLRPGSAHEAALVARAAERLGATARSVTVDVAGGPNLEARARETRHAALESARAAAGASAVLLGHTADDQAETVLLNLLRGSGPTGLGAMAPARGHLRRPLLHLRRADTLEVVALLGLAALHDPMNDDRRFRRVWLRREVLPLLEAGARRDLGEVLARQAEVLRAEGDLLDRLARDALGDLGGGLPLEARALADLDPAIARRVVRLLLGAPPAGFADVEDVLRVARGEAAAATLPGGRRVERARGVLHLVDVSADVGAPGGPGEVPLPGVAVARGLRFESWVEHAPPVAWPDGRTVCVLDADAVGTRTVARAAAPGDRLQPLGLAGTKPVATLLAEAGVAASARPSATVLAATDGASVPPGSVVWVVGYRIDHRVRVGAGTRRFLWISAQAGGNG